MQDQDDFSASYDPRTWAATPRGSNGAPSRAEFGPDGGNGDSRRESASAPGPEARKSSPGPNRPSPRRKRAALFAAIAAAAALLLLGAAAAYLSRRDAKPDAIQRAEAAPGPVLRTISVDNRYEVADALVRAGLTEKRSERLGRQAGDALRAGDSHIMLTLDVAAPRPALVRLEALRPDGSKVVLAAQPTAR